VGITDLLYNFSFPGANSLLPDSLGHMASVILCALLVSCSEYWSKIVVYKVFNKLYHHETSLVVTNH
jgi:hypothetical protein